MSWAPQQFTIGKSPVSNVHGEATTTSLRGNTPALVCFSHLRWSFVYQRPQHLMTRLARDYRVFYVEEPLITENGAPWLEVRCEGGVEILIPRLPPSEMATHSDATQRKLVEDHLSARRVNRP